MKKYFIYDFLKVLLIMLGCASASIAYKAYHPSYPSKDKLYITNEIQSTRSKILNGQFSNEQKATIEQGFEQLSENVSHSYSVTDAQQKKDYWAIKGTVGDFLAGVVGTFLSFAALIFLGLSFLKQSESNKMQLRAFNHDKIESRFFELIRLHKENVNELSFTHYIAVKKPINSKIVTEIDRSTAVMRKFFVIPYDQFKDLQKELQIIFKGCTTKKIYLADYLRKLKANTVLVNRKIDLVEYAEIDLSYLVIFFGVGRTGSEAIRTATSGKYNSSFVEKVIAWAKLKPKREFPQWDKWQKTYKHSNRRQLSLATIQYQCRLEKLKASGKDTLASIEADSEEDLTYGNDYEKFYGGHQFRLGHYFRHLYHMVKFIHDSNLDENDKKSYIKHLRGQLSNNEQTLIFLNSISQLGRTWELESKKDGSALNTNDHLVSEYQLIKNISVDEVMPGISLKKYYPFIKYETADL